MCSAQVQATPCNIKTEPELFPATPAAVTPSLQFHATTPESPQTETPRHPRWDEIIQRLEHIIPEDTFFAIRQTIREALSAAEAPGSAAPPIVACCLRFALAVHDERDMRPLALRTLEKCRPILVDPAAILARILSQKPSSDAATISHFVVKQSQLQTTRSPATHGAAAGKRDVRFNKDVAKQRSRPWNQLIEDIRNMKPNNGHPIRVNITAAIQSAAYQRVDRCHEIVVRLTNALQSYSRKSCGITKQKALDTLELMH